MQVDASMIEQLGNSAGSAPGGGAAPKAGGISAEGDGLFAQVLMQAQGKGTPSGEGGNLESMLEDAMEGKQNLDPQSLVAGDLEKGDLEEKLALLQKLAGEGEVSLEDLEELFSMEELAAKLQELFAAGELSQEELKKMFPDEDMAIQFQELLAEGELSADNLRELFADGELEPDKLLQFLGDSELSAEDLQALISDPEAFREKLRELIADSELSPEELKELLSAEDISTDLADKLSTSEFPMEKLQELLDKEDLSAEKLDEFFSEHDFTLEDLQRVLAEGELSSEELQQLIAESEVFREKFQEMMFQEELSLSDLQKLFSVEELAEGIEALLEGEEGSLEGISLEELEKLLALEDLVEGEITLQRAEAGEADLTLSVLAEKADGEELFKEVGYKLVLQDDSGKEIPWNRANLQEANSLADMFRKALLSREFSLGDNNPGSELGGSQKGLAAEAQKAMEALAGGGKEGQFGGKQSFAESDNMSWGDVFKLAQLSNLSERSGTPFLQEAGLYNSEALKESVLEQITGKLMYFRGGGELPAEMRMTLHPPSLGEVVIRVFSRNGKLAAEIAAETNGAREILESGLSDLRHRLQQMNINLERVDVHTSSRDAGESDNSSQQEEGFSSSGRNKGTFPGKDKAEKEPDERGSPLSPLGGMTVDLWA